MSIERKIESPELQLQYQKDFAMAYGLENGADADYVSKVQNAEYTEYVQKLLAEFKIKKGIMVKDEHETQAPFDAGQKLKEQQQRDHQLALELNSKIGKITIPENQDNIEKLPEREEADSPAEIDKAA